MGSAALTHPTLATLANLRNEFIKYVERTKVLRYAHSSCVLRVDEVPETPMLDKATPDGPTPVQRNARNAHQLFYVTMSLLMLGIVTYGFC